MTLARIPGWLPYDLVHGKDNTVTGNVVVWPSLNSPVLSRSREIAVYLPPSLAAEQGDDHGEGVGRGRRYPVIYFHDGQNMFDDYTSYVGEWHADETLQKLAKEGIEAIAVAIPNAGDHRMAEYSPWRGRGLGGRNVVRGLGDEYLEWVVEVVKPLVDRSFPTRTDRAGTGIMGSSLGGLISLYALTKYPDLFGFVGAMSPSLGWHDYSIIDVFDDDEIARTRIHVDMGGREYRGLTRDARRFRDVLVSKGWVPGRDLNYVEDRYAHHHEDAWSRRLPDALRFLLADAAAVDDVEVAAPVSAA